MRPAYRKNDRDSRARQRTDSCERCGKPHATGACPSFTNNREVPLDDVARAALAGEASGGLPDIDASIVDISGEGLHCLYRCIVVALALIMVVTNIADLRVTLANYIELNPNSIVDPGSPETFAERIYREHKMTVPAYCTMMRCMISGQTQMDYWVVFGPSTMAGKIKAAAAAANTATAATASASAAAAKALKRAAKASAKEAKAKANAKADAAPAAGTKTKKRKQNELNLDDSEDEAPPGCYKCRFISTCTCATPQPNPHMRMRTK
jgi:hypothetical protein